MSKRLEALAPKDPKTGRRVPRWIRCYDNGGDSCDRYTVVYTKYSNYDPGHGRTYYYVGMSGAPYHPQGFGQHGESNKIIDRPKYAHLGKPIKFLDMPLDCQHLVMDDYITMRKLEKQRGELLRGMGHYFEQWENSQPQLRLPFTQED